MPFQRYRMIMKHTSTIQLIKTSKLSHARLRIDYLGKPYLGERLLVQCSFPSLASDDQGCVKKKLPGCRRNDITFAERSGYFVDTDGYEFHADDNLTHVDCEDKCLTICSCVAFEPTKEDGTGCKVWTTMPKFETALNAPKVYFLEYKGKTNSC